MFANPSPGPLTGDQLLKLARQTVVKNKHWRLTDEQFEDAIGEALANGVEFNNALAQGALPVVALSMVKSFRHWEYTARKIFKNEVPVPTTDDAEHYDLYLKGTEDEHDSDSGF